METRLADWMRGTPEGTEAEAILRACVHCGFCNATCPTYQLLGDELDGPRGRIYLIKQLLEGDTATEKTQRHLDRCLTCRSCETTCPSGVKYHRLLDIGRQTLAERLPRPPGQRLLRRLMAEGMTRPGLFAAAVKIGQFVRPLLPENLEQHLPAIAPSNESPLPYTSGASSPAIRPETPQNPGSATAAANAPANEPARASVNAPTTSPQRVLMLAGCVQPTLAPSINLAARRVLAALGIAAIEAPKAGCCGALRFHLDQQGAAREDMRRLIDRWWPFIDNGTVDAIIVTASGCGAHIKDYGVLLRDDPDYAAKAEKISALAVDIGAYLIDRVDALMALLPPAGTPGQAGRVAVHTPCTLQHALKRKGDIERLLGAAGYALNPVAEAHLCCGSAGTYSLLQPELSHALRSRKLDALQGGAAAVPAGAAKSPPADCIVTANIGCLNHLQGGTATPVRHWIELLAARLA